MSAIKPINSEFIKSKNISKIITKLVVMEKYFQNFSKSSFLSLFRNLN